jgi:hypothetical protein
MVFPLWHGNCANRDDLGSPNGISPTLYMTSPVSILPFCQASHISPPIPPPIKPPPIPPHHCVLSSHQVAV